MHVRGYTAAGFPLLLACTAANSRRSTPELEDWWDDFARSLRRRNRSEATAGMYREAFCRIWAWAADVGIDADPAAVTTADVNAFTDKLVASDLSDTTISIVWRNLRPFFTWWARETDSRNPFTGADVPSADDKPTARHPAR
jgi:site-specific recombinase XerD